jgi:histidine decarboxylase
MLENAAHLWDQMRTNFPQLSATRANPLSNTVYFKKPSDAIVKKYSLATMHLDVNNKSEEFAHAVVMPHVSRKILSEFLADLDGRQLQ